MTDAARAPQHIRALDRANEVRLARANLRRRIADGSLTVREVLEDLPTEVATMSIADLLTSQHRWGTTRCRRFLSQIPMQETKPLGTLTARQRAQLIARIDGRPLADPFTDPYALV